MNPLLTVPRRTYLLVPWVWVSSLQHHETVLFLLRGLPSPCCCVTVALAVKAFPSGRLLGVAWEGAVLVFRVHEMCFVSDAASWQESCSFS